MDVLQDAFDLTHRMRGPNMIRNPKESFMHSDCPAIDGRDLESSLIAMPLDALRDARQLTQVQMAQLLKISQGAVSKVERRTDMFVSTLRNYVRAIGGDLQIRAVFPEGEVVIDQFGEHAEDTRARKAAARRDERKMATAVQVGD
jgi:transcriptional regulator with XRE-family HTH domain